MTLTRLLLILPLLLLGGCASSAQTVTPEFCCGNEYQTLVSYVDEDGFPQAEAVTKCFCAGMPVCPAKEREAILTSLEAELGAWLAIGNVEHAGELVLSERARSPCSPWLNAFGGVLCEEAKRLLKKAGTAEFRRSRLKALALYQRAERWAATAASLGRNGTRILSDARAGVARCALDSLDLQPELLELIPDAH